MASKFKSLTKRLKPDHQADSVVVKAAEIYGPEYIPRTKTHGGNVILAKGGVEIVINKGLSGKDRRGRPDTKDILVSDDEDQTVEVSGRYADKKDKKKDGKEIANVSRNVWIFGRLRRRTG